MLFALLNFRLPFWRSARAGQRTLDLNGGWRMEDGRWRMEDGGRRTTEGSCPVHPLAVAAAPAPAAVSCARI